MSNDIRKQIFLKFNLKETDELVEIWQTNDRLAWSEVTYAVIREILLERIGELPPQNEPVWEYSDESEDESDDEKLPEFYDPHQVLRLEKWLSKAAIAAIVASAVSSLIVLPQTQMIVLSFFLGNTEWNFVAWLIAIVIMVFAVSLECIIIYFPLKALASILKILMEMEFNSRGAAKTKNVG